MIEARSGCPINLALEVLGDRWSLIVIRDMIFGGRRHFRDLLKNSQEGIATNILADRLNRLEAHGLITRAQDPAHSQRAILNLTERAIDLLPALVALGAWGRRHLPVTPDLAARQKMLEDGGPDMLAEFMAELRHLHLGVPLPPNHLGVFERLNAGRSAAPVETRSR